MIIYLASFPRSGNTFGRQLIKHYFARVSSSVYLDPKGTVHFEGEDNYQSDVDRRFKFILHDQEHPYRALKVKIVVRYSQKLFGKNSLNPTKIYFIKTHQSLLRAILRANLSIRIVRHPAATLWSYYHYLTNIEHQPVTLDNVIVGYAPVTRWSNYSEAWLNAGKYR